MPTWCWKACFRSFSSVNTFSQVCVSGYKVGVLNGNKYYIVIYPRCIRLPGQQRHLSICLWNCTILAWYTRVSRNWSQPRAMISGIVLAYAGCPTLVSLNSGYVMLDSGLTLATRGTSGYTDIATTLLTSLTKQGYSYYIDWSLILAVRVRFIAHPGTPRSLSSFGAVYSLSPPTPHYAGREQREHCGCLLGDTQPPKDNERYISCGQETSNIVAESLKHHQVQHRHSLQMEEELPEHCGRWMVPYVRQFGLINQ